MSDIGDYLRRRAAELGLERGSQLVNVQQQLDVLYPGQCRAVSINEGELKITTPNASVASDLRLRQTELLKLFQKTNRNITALRLSISS